MSTDLYSAASSAPQQNLYAAASILTEYEKSQFSEAGGLPTLEIVGLDLIPTEPVRQSWESAVSTALVQDSNDGETLQSKDGTRVTLQDDGTLIAETPTGIKTEHKPDGLRIKTYPDGTKLTDYPFSHQRFGRIVEFPDGTRIIETRDGSKITETPDGISILYNATATPPGRSMA